MYKKPEKKTKTAPLPASTGAAAGHTDTRNDAHLASFLAGSNSLVPRITKSTLEMNLWDTKFQQHHNPLPLGRTTDWSKAAVRPERYATMPRTSAGQTTEVKPIAAAAAATTAASQRTSESFHPRTNTLLWMPDLLSQQNSLKKDTVKSSTTAVKSFYMGPAKKVPLERQLELMDIPWMKALKKTKGEPLVGPLKRKVLPKKSTGKKVTFMLPPDHKKELAAAKTKKPARKDKPKKQETVEKPLTEQDKAASSSKKKLTPAKEYTEIYFQHEANVEQDKTKTPKENSSTQAQEKRPPLKIAYNSQPLSARAAPKTVPAEEKSALSTEAANRLFLKVAARLRRHHRSRAAKKTEPAQAQENAEAAKSAPEQTLTGAENNAPAAIDTIIPQKPEIPGIMSPPKEVPDDSMIYRKDPTVILSQKEILKKMAEDVARIEEENSKPSPFCENILLNPEALPQINTKTVVKEMLLDPHACPSEELRAGLTKHQMKNAIRALATEDFEQEISNPKQYTYRELQLIKARRHEAIIKAQELQKLEGNQDKPLGSLITYDGDRHLTLVNSTAVRKQRKPITVDTQKCYLNLRREMQKVCDPQESAARFEARCKYLWHRIKNMTGNDLNLFLLEKCKKPEGRLRGGQDSPIKPKRPKRTIKPAAAKAKLQRIMIEYNYGKVKPRSFPLSQDSQSEVSSITTSLMGHAKTWDRDSISTILHDYLSLPDDDIAGERNQKRATAGKDRRLASGATIFELKDMRPNKPLDEFFEDSDDEELQTKYHLITRRHGSDSEFSASETSPRSTKATGGSKRAAKTNVRLYENLYKFKSEDSKESDLAEADTTTRMKAGAGAGANYEQAKALNDEKVEREITKAKEYIYETIHKYKEF